MVKEGVFGKTYLETFVLVLMERGAESDSEPFLSVKSFFIYALTFEVAVRKYILRESNFKVHYVLKRIF